ncbi:MAG: AAA family ATPase, partial [Chloroflexota bacterium]
MTFIPSTEQQAIFDYVLEHVNKDGKQALAISALAGTGKTTSILELIKLLESKGHTVKGVYCAFNKDIVREVEPRLEGTGVRAKTFHSLSMGSLLNHLKKKLNVNLPKDFVDANKYIDLINRYIDTHETLTELFEDAVAFDEESSPTDVRKVFVKASYDLCHYMRVRLEKWDDKDKLNWLIDEYDLTDPLLTGELIDIMVDMQPV